jgi:hypothetical protein
MNIVNNILKRKPNTLLGKAMSNFIKELGPISFLLYFIPIITLVLINDVQSGGEVAMPIIYKVLIIWYFFALWIFDKIDTKGKRKREIVKAIITFPLVFSLVLAYYIVQLFINKKKYPDITPEQLPEYKKKLNIKQRKHKIKKVVRKTKRKKIWGM